MVTRESRSSKKGCRDLWSHDKVVRSTHGVNCTGSGSWKIYVKAVWSPGKRSRPTTEPLRASRRAPGVGSGREGQNGLLTIVLCFALRVTDGLEEPTSSEPIDPLEGGVFPRIQ